VNFERHSWRQAMTRFDQHTTCGHVDDRHRDAATNASRLDAVFSNRSAPPRKTTLDGW
jgi:hypothetical protein